MDESLGKKMDSHKFAPCNHVAKNTKTKEKIWSKDDKCHICIPGSQDCSNVPQFNYTLLPKCYCSNVPPHLTITAPLFYYNFFYFCRRNIKTLNVGTNFSSFNPFGHPLRPIAADDREQFQCLNIVVNNKTGHFI